MTYDQWHELTDEQRQAFRNLQERSGIELEEMIRQAFAPGGAMCPYVGIPDFHGMFVGIEPDGYTHS